MKILPHELPQGWRLQHAYGGEEQPQFWACVLNGDTISIENERLKRFHGCPFVVGVDIFPLDYISTDKQQRELELALFRLIYKGAQLAKRVERTNQEERDLEDAIKGINMYLHTKIQNDGNVISNLWIIANQLVISFGKNGGKYLTEFTRYARNLEYKLNSSWYDEIIYVPFEIMDIPIPYKYDLILKTQFGNYMERRRGEQDHDYPFYKLQIEYLKKITEEKFE